MDELFVKIQKTSTRLNSEALSRLNVQRERLTKSGNKNEFIHIGTASYEKYKCENRST